MCQSFFHTNEIVSKYNSGCPVKFINNALIICQGHQNVALTLNLPYGELSSEAMQLTAQIKLHGEKFISKLYYFHKKIHYFFSDAGIHSKSRIFTILNSTFCDGRKNNKNYY